MTESPRHAQGGASNQGIGAATLRVASLVGRVILALGGFLALSLVALGLSLSVPDTPIVEHLKQGVASGALVDPYPVNGLGGPMDRYTECIGAGMGVLPQNTDLGVFQKVSMIPRLGSCAELPQHLQALESSTDNVGPSSSYFRYWAGFLVISRATMAAWGIEGTRIVAGFFLLAGLATFVTLLGRKWGVIPAFAFLGVTVLSSDLLSLPFQFTHALAQASLYFAASLVLFRGRSVVSVALTSSLAGAFFVFMDLLTTPGSAWALTVFAAAVVASTQRVDALFLLGRGFLSAFSWIFGYAFMWVMRWLVAMPYHGVRATLDNVVQTAKFRLGGDVSPSGMVVEIDPNPVASLRVLASYWLGQPVVALVVGISLLVGVAALVALFVGKGRSTLLLLWAPVLLVFVWYAVLRNHSQVHAFFTYRAQATALAIFLASSIFMLHSVMPRLTQSLVHLPWLHGSSGRKTRLGQSEKAPLTKESC
ncbi:MAG: hypothetical protein Q4G30_04720 [Actinomycetaceae bacterium]|nr:hypothetical protein [Actinomycetaceae bacterium]